jgi:hypothetical protein
MRGKTAPMLFILKVNELQETALYDDCTPAQGAEIEVQSDGKTVAEGVTDETAHIPSSPIATPGRAPSSVNRPGTGLSLP